MVSSGRFALQARRRGQRRRRTGGCCCRRSAAHFGSIPPTGRTQRRGVGATAGTVNSANRRWSGQTVQEAAKAVAVSQSLGWIANPLGHQKTRSKVYSTNKCRPTHSTCTTVYLPLIPPTHRQSSQYRRIEIRVMEARGLAKADRFGLSDPYVVIYANGQTEVNLPCRMDGRCGNIEHWERTFD